MTSYVSKFLRCGGKASLACKTIRKQNVAADLVPFPIPGVVRRAMFNDSKTSLYHLSW